jgi:hypothetical protein
MSILKRAPEIRALRQPGKGSSCADGYETAQKEGRQKEKINAMKS